MAHLINVGYLNCDLPTRNILPNKMIDETEMMDEGEHQVLYPLPMESLTDTLHSVQVRHTSGGGPGGGASSLAPPF